MSKPPTMRDAIAEADEIRSKLRLRFNTSLGCWQVFTTILGSGVFKWFCIAEHTANWYKSNFNPPVEENKIDLVSGAFSESYKHSF